MSPRASPRPLDRRASLVRRRAPERLAAWLYVGPVGHLVGFLGDLAAALLSHWTTRGRAALAGGRGGSRS